MTSPGVPMTESPARSSGPAAQASGRQADVLSDVLRSVRLTSAVYFDMELRSPWAAEAPPSREIAAVVMPGAQRVMEYHLIARGSCWAHRVGDEPVRLNEGDLIVFPQGDPHVLSSAPGMRSAPDVAIYTRPDTPLPIVYEAGGTGTERTRVICCFLGCDERPFNPLLRSLPPVIHLSSAARGSTSPGWLATLLQIAVHESASARPGREDVLARMAELLFVEAVRRHVEALPASDLGWLAGLRDPIVGGALAALHGDPAARWTVESLARAVGASRSVLADRFTALTGQPPMQYLALWRMQLASRLLLEGRSVAGAAGDVGYESEAAFSRTFKKLVGEAPGTWRRANERRGGEDGKED
jgi:AraC-like DNA-binding protein